MARERAENLHGLHGERKFRWRGGDVSRIEALADAAFALTLDALGTCPSMVNRLWTAAHAWLRGEMKRT